MHTRDSGRRGLRTPGTQAGPVPSHESGSFSALLQDEGLPSLCPGSRDRWKDYGVCYPALKNKSDPKPSVCKCQGSESLIIHHNAAAFPPPPLPFLLQASNAFQTFTAFGIPTTGLTLVLAANSFQL